VEEESWSSLLKGVVGLLGKVLDEVGEQTFPGVWRSFLTTQVKGPMRTPRLNVWKFQPEV
jgi:hypothetical protein